jgi:tRNA-Thr(GGU) m(6)t(6)A37 methyltransferase TsaA
MTDAPRAKPAATVANDPALLLRPIGRVESPLLERADAPKQGDEGSPAAFLLFDDDLRAGIRDLTVGSDVLVLTWFDRADREVLLVHPRGDRARPATGVFSTRSPDRPNPIGLHRVTITAIDGPRVGVQHLEALNGTPILDVKPILGDLSER